jgi:hypothetical protein
MKEKSYISKRLDPKIDEFNKNAKRNGFFYKFFTILQLILSSFIPVATAFSSVNSFDSKIIIAAIGTLISIITGICSLNKYHENWISQTHTYELLVREKQEYQSKIGKYTDSITGNNTFISQCENIILKNNIEWVHSKNE